MWVLVELMVFLPQFQHSGNMICSHDFQSASPDSPILPTSLMQATSPALPQLQQPNQPHQSHKPKHTVISVVFT